MSKRLIVCADGTWNDEDATGAATNVAKLHACLQTKYVEGVDQRVYYHSGVGTRWGERLLGGAFGAGINRNIIDCYTFLVENYEPGDELYFFGFSRGAYTVRSLAGLIRNSGIVRERAQIGRAFELYRSSKHADMPGAPNAIAFRSDHAKEARAHVADDQGDQYKNSPEIKFIGVWDTVGSLGYPLPFFPVFKPVLTLLGLNWWFHDTDLSTTVKYAYHALAIHERRSDFPPTLWKMQLVGDQPKRPDQILEQVFFPGVHCDVGGGYGGAALSDVAYRWMVAKAAATGLLFRDEARDPGMRLAPDPLGRLHESFTGAFLAFDVLRFRFHGRPRVFESGNEYHARIADSAVERFRKMPGTVWPETGNDQSFKARLEALAKAANGSPDRAAPVLVDLRTADVRAGASAPPMGQQDRFCEPPTARAQRAEPAA
jgi:uncharacterized protein (DUF2235 family)